MRKLFIFIAICLALAGCGEKGDNKETSSKLTYYVFATPPGYIDICYQNQDGQHFTDHYGIISRLEATIDADPGDYYYLSVENYEVYGSFILDLIRFNDGATMVSISAYLDGNQIANDIHSYKWSDPNRFSLFSNKYEISGTI